MQHASSAQRMLPTRASASVDEIRRLTRKLRAQHGMRRIERHRAHAVGTACIRCRRNTVHHVSCPARGAPHANKWIGLSRGRPDCAHARIIAAAFRRTMGHGSRDLDLLRLKVCGVGWAYSSGALQWGANPGFSPISSEAPRTGRWIVTSLTQRAVLQSTCGVGRRSLEAVKRCD